VAGISRNRCPETPEYAPEIEWEKVAKIQIHLGKVYRAAGDTTKANEYTQKGLASLLLNPAITKIFHACIQDMEVLYHYLGALPCPLEDTQIAAALLNEKDQMGYANLLFDQLDIQLEKTETRTNWLKRPLTSKQLEYAADDVRYLLPLHKKLTEQLESKGREDWLIIECNKLCQSAARYLPDFENCWPRVKGTHKLSNAQLAVVDTVAQWREHIAIKKDTILMMSLG